MGLSPRLRSLRLSEGSGVSGARCGSLHPRGAQAEGGHRERAGLGWGQVGSGLGT